MCAKTSTSLSLSFELACCHKYNQVSVSMRFCKSEFQNCNYSQEGKNKNIFECLQGAGLHSFEMVDIKIQSPEQNTEYEHLLSSGVSK